MQSPYSIPAEILDAFDVKALIEKMERTDWYYEYSDDRRVWEKGLQEIAALKKELLEIGKTEKGLEFVVRLWLAYVPVDSVSIPEPMREKANDITSQLKKNEMNENNYDYLKRQVAKHGFGLEHDTKLKEHMLKGTPEFALTHQQAFGKDQTVATLQFRKPDNGELYFFNRYSLMVKNEQMSAPIKQTFYINNKQDNTTLKEAYNLLSGRAVLKNFTTKEDVKYQSWVQLNFKDSDVNGNYKEIKNSMDLEKVYAKYAIKELDNPEHKKRLTESLQRGNLQSVTMAIEGKEQKVFIEAAPKYKSFNVYDADMKKIYLHTTEKKSEEQAEKKEESKKQTQTNDTSSAEEGTAGKKNNPGKRKNVKLS